MPVHILRVLSVLLAAATWVSCSRPPLTGSTGWTSQETPFLLERGQNPDHVALNIVITGRGTVWVDDIALVRAPR